MDGCVSTEALKTSPATSGAATLPSVSSTEYAPDRRPNKSQLQTGPTASL